MEISGSIGSRPSGVDVVRAFICIVEIHTSIFTYIYIYIYMYTSIYIYIYIQI